MRRQALAVAACIWCLALPAAAQDAKKNFLWKVEGPNNSTAYLLGSLHVLTPDYYPLSPVINKAFAESRTLVEEVDLDEIQDPSKMAGAMARAFLTDGRSLDQLVAPSTYAELTKRAEKAGLPMMALRRMKPWLVSLTLMGPTLQAAGLSAEYGVDKHFFDRATAAGMTRQAFETVTYQLDRFDGLSLELQEDMLTSTIRELDTYVVRLRDIAQAWATGNVRGIEKELLSSFDQSPELYNRLLTERNRNWIPQVDTCLRQNAGCFIVVGAAHLVGPDSLPALLAKSGYRVTQQ
ncbi:MAG: TraB/GumN family protein [Acidobacteria bacterium]|nr:TraB/GumN family protein [Acidobacteriota bacterium]